MRKQKKLDKWERDRLQREAHNKERDRQVAAVEESVRRLSDTALPTGALGSVFLATEREWLADAARLLRRVRNRVAGTRR